MASVPREASRAWTPAVVGVLIVAGPAGARAEVLKVSGLIQIWATVNGADIRRNAGETPPNRYYNLRPEFAQDGFTVRRTELRVSIRPLPKLELTVMADPSISTGSIVQDAVVLLRPMARLLLQVGQFKTQQTHEGLLSSVDLMSAERGQAARAFGDTRDRGVVASWSFGDGTRVSGATSAAVFNGSGRREDLNPTKDVVVRFELRRGTRHLAGAYGLLGSTDVADGTTRVPLSFGGVRAPSPERVLARADRTTNMGAFYVFDSGRWLGSVEGIGGRWGRRAPSLGSAPAPARREHLRQRFIGVTLTAAVRVRRFTLAVRHDVLDANAGDDSYGDRHLYGDPVTARDRNGYAPPCYSETTIGGVLPLTSGTRPSLRARVNYIHRSSSVVRRRTGQSRPLGGDSLVGSLQAAF